jgi:hypothetical protein
VVGRLRCFGWGPNARPVARDPATPEAKGLSTVTVIVQNRYFVHPGHHDEAIEIHRRVNTVRRDAGRPRGRILLPVEIGPEVPNLIWECEYADLDALNDDITWADSTPESTEVHGQLADITDRFERLVFRVALDDYPARTVP